jgi:hypothetical protein
MKYKFRKIALIISIALIGVQSYYFHNKNNTIKQEPQYYIKITKTIGIPESNKPIQILDAPLSEPIKTDERKYKEFKDKEDKMAFIIIKQYIIDNQPNMSDKEAGKYAIEIVRQSKLNKVSPYYQAAIGKTESDFDKDAIHSLSYVYGMNGVSAKDWGEFLKEKGIINHDKELKDPCTNIKASSAIFAYYMDRSKTVREAITRYKGYCSVGKERADKVVKIAMMLKHKEKEMNEYKS